MIQTKTPAARPAQWQWRERHNMQGIWDLCDEGSTDVAVVGFHRNSGPHTSDRIATLRFVPMGPGRRIFMALTDVATLWGGSVEGLKRRVTDTIAYLQANSLQVLPDGTGKVLCTGAPLSREELDARLQRHDCDVDLARARAAGKHELFYAGHNLLATPDFFIVVEVLQ